MKEIVQVIKIQSGGTEDDLKNTFTLAYSIFNENKDPTIGGLLDQNVTVFSVKHQDHHTGIDEVVQYFRDQFVDGPDFAPTTKNYKVSGNGLSGRVSGRADWADKNGKEVINYDFKFLYDGGKWLISVLYAKP